MHHDPLLDVLSSDQESTLILSSSLEIQRLPDSASVLFDLFFPDSQRSGTRLPFPLHCWIIDQVQHQRTSLHGKPFKSATTFSQHGRILIAILFQHPKVPEFRLYLEEDPTAREAYESICAQLTRRQLEMYHLIKEGERDIRTIAQKMGISVRTAEGHKMNLQRILPRL